MILDIPSDTKWISTDNAYCGRGNIYFAYTRDTLTNHEGSLIFKELGTDVYKFTVYIASNSYTTDCNRAGSTIEGISIKYKDFDSNGEWMIPPAFYEYNDIVSKEIYKQSYTLYCNDPNMSMKISWKNIKPF